MNEKLYKVLMNGESMYGGDLKWSLPRKRGKGYQPGQWHEVEGDIRVCHNGLHLTSEPYEWYQLGSQVYEAEGAGESQTEDDKTAFRRARLLRPIPEPAWLVKTKELVAEIKTVQWMQNDHNPNPEWKVFSTRDAAREAARDAAAREVAGVTGTAAWAAWAAAGVASREAAREAVREVAWVAGAAAWDARLYIQIQGICSDLPLDEIHRIHAASRWEVWRKGYGLLCDVNGILYVYEKAA